MEFSELLATGQAVKRLQHRHHHALDSRLRKIGTSLSQWDALRHVAGSPGASTHELAQMTFMTDQSFGALAIKLAEQGLIARTQGRGRVVHHRITPEGTALLEEAASITEKVMSESFAPLSAAERRSLRTLLERVLAG
ncbi:MarR family transcriptional regulator [Streptomyces sp. NPDC048484]|uniref:MarR family winged helix-turn-helix transcriptional regulator n=1 Tax=Streptomyces sp. NPDC048484 TaxID=3155146 RepID=UPI003413303D